MSGIPKLSDVMRSQTVTITNDGYEMESIAGKAFYSVSGLRGKVEGIPEYFPITLTVNNKRNITQLVSDTTSQSAGKFSGTVRAPDKTHLCGNTIEQETLSAVLVHYLPTTDLDKAREHAVKLASAVKASFAELDRATGGYVIDKCASAFISSGKIIAERIPSSPLKPSLKGEGEQASTLMIKVEIDASSVLQSLDEVESAISKHLATGLDKALKPGGTIWSAIKNHR
ncbi:hypothetical protein [Raoultella ornithinolytica]|uniref:hypothetical protein n=1 Tax=Raoultella ornithinolytica TaxID=54291 RepID=UPI000A78C413|nr:hypothetical protein [Raoultella ornithinolytica]